MKIVILSLFMFNCAWGQNLSGIGFLKINKTHVAVIDSLFAQGYQLKKGNDLIDSLIFSGREIMPLRIVTQANDKNFFEAPLIPQHKKYKIGKLVIADVLIKWITLDFYNDTLYAFNFSQLNDEFHEVLDSKFSPLRVEVKRRFEKCKNSKIELIDTTKTYPSEISISATTIRQDLLGYDCFKNKISSFEIYDILKRQLIEKKEESALLILKKEEEKRQIERRKDF